MLGSPRDGEEGTGFFSFTHEEDGLTLIMDDRSYAAFEESALIERVTCAPDRWRAFEIHLGSLAWEVPGLVCFLSTIMAESRISILNLSTCDRDFVLVPPQPHPPARRPRHPPHPAVGPVRRLHIPYVSPFMATSEPDISDC